MPRIETRDREEEITAYVTAGMGLARAAVDLVVEGATDTGRDFRERLAQRRSTNAGETGRIAVTQQLPTESLEKSPIAA